MYNDHKVKSLHIMLPKASAYIKRYIGQTKWIYFLNEDDDLLGLFRIKPVLTTKMDKASADTRI